jgi:chromosome segregation ATPase
MKLHNDYIESKMEEFEELLSENENMKNIIEKYEKKINLDEYSTVTDKKENEIFILKAENTNLKSTIKTLDEKLNKLQDVEKKMNITKKQYEKEIENLNLNLEKLNKKLLSYEEMIKNANTISIGNVNRISLFSGPKEKMSDKEGFKNLVNNIFNNF